MSTTPSSGKQSQRLGCVTALVLLFCSLVVSSLLVLFVGSMAAEFAGIQGFFPLALLGLLVCLIPSLAFNGILTSIRTRFRKKGSAHFGDTLLHSVFFLNATFLVSMTLLMPMSVGKALRSHGGWPFGKQMSQLLEIKPEHPVLQAGRRFVKQMAYFLEEDQRPALQPLPAGSRTEPSVQAAPAVRAQPGLRLPPRGHLVAKTNNHSTKVRLLKSGNSLIIGTKLGRQGIKAKFLLDTGASYLTLSPKMARRLGVRPEFSAPRMTLQTANGRLRTRVGLLPELRLGQWTLKNVAFVMCHSCADRGRGLVGLLGLNILNRFRYTIDRRELWIRLEKTRDSGDQDSDLRPFVMFRHLRGETRFGMLAGRKFMLTGWVYNRATQGMRNVILKVTYLQRGKKLVSRRFRLGNMRGPGRKFFRFRDPKPPKFRRYRIELGSARWARTSGR